MSAHRQSSRPWCSLCFLNCDVKLLLTARVSATMQDIITVRQLMLKEVSDMSKVNPPGSDRAQIQSQVCLDVKLMPLNLSRLFFLLSCQVFSSTINMSRNTETSRCLIVSVWLLPFCNQTVGDHHSLICHFLLNSK